MPPSTKIIIVNGLRALWVLLTLWYEYGIWSYSAGQCAWPDSTLMDPSSHTKPTHVLLIADPHVLDRHSYSARPAILTHTWRFLVNLNLRKTWRAATRSRPDAVLFLGDMMDSGRLVMSDAEYEQYAQQLMKIFPLSDHIPEYFIPGNRDTGLGYSPHFSPHAQARYISHFGPPNRHISIANHSFVLIDAPTLVEEDYQRHGRGLSYALWNALPGGAIDFVKSFAAEGHTQPVILLSHIPLSRPEGSNCGPLRERGTIHRGVGIGYQNMLGKDSSRFLLEYLTPTMVFSADDHDYCDYTHPFEAKIQSTRVREVTVKSLSIASGIRRPGYHLLSLLPPGSPKVSHSDLPCFMPDQLGIYLSIYIPLAITSLLVVLISCIIRGQHYRLWTLRPSLSSTHSRGKSKGSVSFSHRKKPTISRIVIDIEEYGYTLDADVEEKDKLPTPASSPTTRYTLKQVTWRFFSGVRRKRVPLVLGSIWSLAKGLLRRRGGLAGEFLRDVRDIGVFPLAIFILTTLWTLKDF